MLCVTVGAVSIPGCQKDVDLIGREGDNRLAALERPVRSRDRDLQPVGYQPQQHDRGGREPAGGDIELAALPDRAGQQTGIARNGAAAAGDSAGAPTADERPKQRDRVIADRGAAQLIGLMKESLGTDADGSYRTSIAVRALRNQSRTNANEIEALRGRMVALLNAASTDDTLRFTHEVTDATEYTLGGTVYLIQRDGFDQWELYLALRPVDANWTIWRNDDPVRMLRQKRAGGDSMQLVRE